MSAGDDAGEAMFDAGDLDPVDDSRIATGMTSPRSLIVVGDRLFWIEQDDATHHGSIKSVSVDGGTPTSIVSREALSLNLVSDGTSLYFASGTPTTAPGSVETILLKSDLDGASVTTIADVGLCPIPAASEGLDPTNQLFLANGTLYFLAATAAGDGSIPAFQPTSLTTTGVATTLLTAPGGFRALDWADSTGLYLTADDGSGGAVVERSPLVGGTTTALLHPPSSEPWTSDQMAVVNGELYLAVPEPAANNTRIVKFAAASAGDGGMDIPVASLSHWSANSFAADANGIYITQSVVADTTNGPGVYAVSAANGATALFEKDPSGSAYDLTLDAKNVYWFEYTDFNRVRATLHAKAR